MMYLVQITAYINIFLRAAAYNILMNESSLCVLHKTVNMATNELKDS